jgi:hypothetical protein
MKTYRAIVQAPNVVVEWVKLLRIWEVPDSDLDPEAGYPD